MPILRIMSVYRQRQRSLGPELARARDELARFEAALVARFGRDGAAAIRMHANWTEDMIFGRVKVPELPEGGDHARRTLRQLRQTVQAVLREIRTPDCWFWENPEPISVLETVGLSWAEVRGRCSTDGRLPVAEVLRLLNILRTTKQIMPSREQVTEWAASGCSPCHLWAEWRRVLWSRRRRLMRLLSAAVELEEEVRFAGQCDRREQ
jgi:hypothetical protein